jgi:hypothetical protein
MPRKIDKYLVEFFAEWLTNPALRKKVLFRERDAMLDWGLSPSQVQILTSLRRNDIRDLLVKELVDDRPAGAGIDLDGILKAFEKYPARGGRAGGFAGMLYEQNATHVRGIDTKKIKAGVKSRVTVRGHGWNNNLKVWFVPPPGAPSSKPVQSKLIKMTSDIDVWQHAVVDVKLPSKGAWRVMAEVKNNRVRKSTENVTLKVT